MVFSSLVFIFAFLPLTILIYYICPDHMKNAVLLFASLIFYGWGEPVYIALMIFTTIINYLYGLIIDKYRHYGTISKRLLILSTASNLCILGFYKYSGFILQNINHITGSQFEIPYIALPLGISFYTFQAMSYVIDVYRGDVHVQKDLVSFGAYVTMFPQLVAGPIVKYGDIALQLSNRKESLSLFGEGAFIFITGLAKKVLLANNLGILWKEIKSAPLDKLPALSAWLGIAAFTLQIYLDFSGYSDMAVGLGKMFGFNFTKNFDYPYASKSITEFWRRWHISLGNWFRDYVYIPLGGNKNGKLKQYKNIIVVWLLTGLWHGASWNFVLWGLYFAFFLVIEKIYLLKWLGNANRVFSHFYTLLIVMGGWVIFEFEDLYGCLGFFKSLVGLGPAGYWNNDSIYYLYTNISVLVIACICSTPSLKLIWSYIPDKYKPGLNSLQTAASMMLMLLSTAYLVNESYNPFLYFRF